VPARNNDDLKHPPPVRLDQRELPSSALPATIFMSLAAAYPFRSSPSQQFSLIFSSPILAAISFFLFSLPILWNSTALNPALLLCATAFFSDSNSSLALFLSFQFSFITLHIDRT